MNFKKQAPIYRVARQHCPVFKREFDPLKGVDFEIRKLFRKIQIKRKISTGVPNHVFQNHSLISISKNVVKIKKMDTHLPIFFCSDHIF